MRLIDGEALYKSLADLYKERGFNDREIHFSLKDMEMNINGAPAVDVVLNFTGVDVRHGHWIEHEVGLICSECNHYTEAMYDEPFNNEFGKGWAWRRPYYCGYCGAKMDEVET